MNITQCDCCKEIWSEEKFTGIPLGNSTLYLCPDCLEKLADTVMNKKYTEFKKLYNRGNK